MRSTQANGPCNRLEKSIAKSNSGRNQVNSEILESKFLVIEVVITPFRCPIQLATQGNQKTGVGLIIIYRAIPARRHHCTAKVESKTPVDTEFKVQVSEITVFNINRLTLSQSLGNSESKYPN